MKFGPKEFAELVSLIDQNIISGKTAKDIFANMIEKGGNPREIVEKEGLTQITDAKQLEIVIDQIIESNPDSLQKFKSGNERLFGFFVGQVIKQTNGRANAEVVNALLQKKLKE